MTRGTVTQILIGGGLILLSFKMSSGRLDEATPSFFPFLIGASGVVLIFLGLEAHDAIGEASVRSAAKVARFNFSGKGQLG